MKIGLASARGIIYSVNEEWGVCRVVFVQIAPREFRLFRVGNWLNRYTDEEYFRDQDVPDDFTEVGESVRQPQKY